MDGRLGTVYRPGKAVLTLNLLDWSELTCDTKFTGFGDQTEGGLDPFRGNSMGKYTMYVTFASKC